jgi:hypothetical protein
MYPSRVLPSPTRTLVFLIVAGLLLAGSLAPSAGSTSDARISPPLTTDDGQEQHVTFRCYRATIETTTTATVTLHFPDGLEQRLVLSPGTHTVRGTGINQDKPLTALTVATGVSVQRHDNPRYLGCERRKNTMITTTTTTSTSTATATTTTTTSTSTTSTTTTTSTPLPTTTTPTSATTETPTTTATTATTPPTTTRTSTTTGDAPTASTSASRPAPDSATTARTPASAAPESEPTQRESTQQTTAGDDTDTTGTTSVTETDTERGSPTGTAVPNGSNANSGGGELDPPLRGGDTPENEWTVGDTVAILLVCLGGLLIVAPSALGVGSSVVSRVTASQER